MRLPEGFCIYLFQEDFYLTYLYFWPDGCFNVIDLNKISEN
jgi:hypothetical protein